MLLIADAHCDTVTEMLDKNESLFRNSGHTDLVRMKAQGSFLQFFALFVDPKEYDGFETKRFTQSFNFLHNQVEKYKDYISICKNYDEIQHTISTGKTAGLISIENGGVLQGDIANLAKVYEQGVRSICLTWNYANEIADGVKDSHIGRGLTAFGKEVVTSMNKLGMLVDVSHLSEKSFWDVMEVTRMPIMASHSNAKTICGHPRNLTDSQIKTIKQNNGFIGINLYPNFLNNSGESNIDDIVRHIEYITSLIGENHIGLGGDFDGVELLPDGIKGVEDLHKIFERLLALNYKEEFIRKFAGENLLSIIKNVLVQNIQ